MCFCFRGFLPQELCPVSTLSTTLHWFVVCSRIFILYRSLKSLLLYVILAMPITNSFTSFSCMFFYCYNHLKHDVGQRCSGVSPSHIHSWTSSGELINWLINQNDLYLFFFSFHFQFHVGNPAIWRSFSHWQAGLRVGCHGVPWLTAALCNHITDSAKEPHHSLSLKSH